MPFYFFYSSFLLLLFYLLFYFFYFNIKNKLIKYIILNRKNTFEYTLQYKIIKIQYIIIYDNSFISTFLY